MAERPPNESGHGGVPAQLHRGAGIIGFVTWPAPGRTRLMPRLLVTMFVAVLALAAGERTGRAQCTT